MFIIFPAFEVPVEAAPSAEHLQPLHHPDSALTVRHPFLFTLLLSPECTDFSSKVGVF